MKTPTVLPNDTGKYFITDECDGCAYCALVAPEHFDYDKSANRYFMARQPQTPCEMELVAEAMDDCPVDAIQVRQN